MAEPDELYTLRAQFALGHYGLALQESKQVARRPLSANLQAEREEYAVRALTALRQYSKIEEGDRPGRYYIYWNEKNHLMVVNVCSTPIALLESQVRSSHRVSESTSPDCGPAQEPRFDCGRGSCRSTHRSSSSHDSR